MTKGFVVEVLNARLYMIINVIRLQRRISLFCPQCEAKWTVGSFFVEVARFNGRFILAELCQCCGNPHPVVTLFDSPIVAKEAGDRICQNVTVGTNFSSLPVLSREFAFQICPLELLIA